LRILHAPVNIAGQPFAMVKALRRKGLDAELLVFKERPFVRGYDRSLHLERRSSRLVKWLVALRAFLQAAPRYDLFHYHSVSLLFPVRWDLPILRSLGKKLVIQFWGSDVRGKDPHDLTYLRYVDAIIVGSYHMLDFVPEGAHTVLPGLDLGQWRVPASTAARVDTSREQSLRPGVVRVVHAPSQRRLKGTAHVLKAVEQLQACGVPLELVLIEAMPHAEAVKIYETCDIAIDQLAAGWYGVFALEAMALGKVVMGYISPRNAHRLETARGLQPPIASVSPDTLIDALESLIRAPGRRLELGRLSRCYVERLHDIDHSAEQVMHIYQQV
jgi:glycosyltransferase involved in cell wall biosynthesis